jgi:hypothetical protein
VAGIYMKMHKYCICEKLTCPTCPPAAAITYVFAFCSNYIPTICQRYAPTGDSNSNGKCIYVVLYDIVL